jgi:hypothetical protein
MKFSQRLELIESLYSQVNLLSKYYNVDSITRELDRLKSETNEKIKTSKKYNTQKLMSEFKGEIKKLNRQGYVKGKNENGFRHRELWEETFGPIPKMFHIHHINGVRDQNTLDNLVAIPKNFHEWLHKQEDYFEFQEEHKFGRKEILAVWQEFKNIPRGQKSKYQFKDLYLKLYGNKPTTNPSSC